MARNTQHVVPNSKGGWNVKKGGSTKASGTYKTQKEAIAHAKEISKNQKAELFIHRENGTIRERNSYGHDPHPPKG